MAELGVDVYGISMDSVADQAKFTKAQELNFPLLSDPDGSAAAKYQVRMKDRPLAARVTFVIDEQGTVRHIDREVNVDSHGSDLISLLRALRSR